MNFNKILLAIIFSTIVSFSAAEEKSVDTNTTITTATATATETEESLVNADCGKKFTIVNFIKQKKVWIPAVVFVAYLIAFLYNKEDGNLFSLKSLSLGLWNNES